MTIQENLWSYSAPFMHDWSALGYMIKCSSGNRRNGPETKIITELHQTNKSHKGRIEICLAQVVGGTGAEKSASSQEAFKRYFARPEGVWGERGWGTKNNRSVSSSSQCSWGTHPSGERKMLSDLGVLSLWCWGPACGDRRDWGVPSVFPSGLQCAFHIRMKTWKVF